MNNYLKVMLVFSFVLAFLTACQKSPESGVVVSKNDGSFDVSVIQSATEATKPTQNDTASEEVVLETEPSPSYYFEQDFSSSDGSVTFQMRLDVETRSSSMPVVEVSPHFLTEEDVQRVGKALLGNADFYEAEPLMAPVYSKSELQEKITRWSAYDGEGIGFDDYNAARNRYIQEYTLLMETAPEENPHRSCSWTFKKGSEYVLPADELATAKTDQDCDEIQACAKVNGIPYNFHAAKRNSSDYKLNQLYLDISDGSSPYNSDLRIFHAQLCRTPAPTEEDLHMLKEKAASLLKEMALGEWEIDQCTVETEYYGDTPEYVVTVTAVPSFKGIPACRRPQINNLKSSTTYASNYYLTDAQFQFGVKGDLLGFEMYSPVDLKSVISPNVQTLNLEDLMQTAVNHFTLSDAHAYDVQQYLDGNVELDCTVYIDHADYGLSRVKVPNTDESYYYLPAIVFWGHADYTEKDTGLVLDNYGEEHPFLILNAIDGSIINATNE